LLKELDKRDEDITELINLYKDLDNKIKEYRREQELKEILREIRNNRFRNKKSFSCFN